ncbi:MAG: RIO1 family regulatory kinase/ATPase [Kofleriaceae bacterium]
MQSPAMSDALAQLLDDGVIDEVLSRLKSGKEANVSLVRRGAQVLAAKVYKDRATRSFKSNAEYKEGRKVRNTRTQRSIDRGSSFGRDAEEEAWKSAEADALYKLAGTGVRVPTPVMFYEGVLLMELVVDGAGAPAPRLIDVDFDPAGARAVYLDLMRQMIAMLCCDLIHGDLSPYNILVAAAGPTIIDLPQVISAAHNSRAEHFFLRDFDNIVGFVAGFDPTLAAHAADGRAIWRAYTKRDLTPEFVPPPPPPPWPTRGPDRRGPRPDERPGRRVDPRDARAPRPLDACGPRALDLRGPRLPDARGPRPPDERPARPSPAARVRPTPAARVRPRDTRAPRPPDARGSRPDERPGRRFDSPDARGPRPSDTRAPRPPDHRAPPRRDDTTGPAAHSRPGPRPTPAPPPSGGHRRRPRRYR